MISGSDAAELLAVSAATSAVVTFTGMQVLRAARRRPLRDALLVVALTPVITVVVAAAVATMAMFLSTSQFGVLIATVVFAGLGGAVTSMLLARTIMRGSDALRAAASALTRGEPFVAPDATPSAELQALSRELEVAHAKLAQAREHERAIETSRRELIAWVSHDLRTPLAGIRAMAEALEDDVVSTDADRSLYYRRIRLEIDRLARMVDDLFELSRIHAGALTLSLQRLALPDVVREAVASAAPLAQRKGIFVATCAPSDARALVDVDPRAFLRVISNLLSNAIRHTPHDGSIVVEADHDERFAYVSVSDECGGIEEHDLERVFEVAYRGSAARTPDPDGGAGLGLAIARGIVAAHAGRIVARNAGAGCRFTVTLPLADSAVVGAAASGG